MEHRLEEQDNEALEEALVKAEEAARHVIENALGPRASHYNISLTIVYSNNTPERLIVDIHIVRPRAKRDILKEVIEAAIAAAEEVFERELNRRMDKRSDRGNSRY